MQLRGQVIVVTGGATGIGAALCRRVAREGPAAIAVVDRDAAGARAVAAEVGGMPLVADLGTDDGVRSAIRTVEDVYGPIDVYCSNAGIMVGGGPATPDADWQAAWDINVMAHVRAMRLLLPSWRERGEGYFVGMVSAAALLNHVLAAPYAATKAAALSVLEWLAITCADTGVHVSAVCPEGVRTGMLDARSRFLAAAAIEPSDVAEAVMTGLAEGAFLILPHERVGQYAALRGADHDRWLRGMRRLRERLPAELLEDAWPPP